MINRDFARTLSLLRQERGLRQREAAEALGISQGLLSHYENGNREPGLDFVCKACSFYGVTADYMLGRSMNRDGSVIDAADVYDASGEKASLRGNILATLHKKLIGNTVNVLFDLLGKTNSESAINAASGYLSMGLYQLFRAYHRASGGNADAFGLDEDAFAMDVAGVLMKKSEFRLVRSLRDVENIPEFSSLRLQEEYPGLVQSVNQVLHEGDRAIREALED